HIAAYFVSLVFVVLVDPLATAVLLLATIGPYAWRSLSARRLAVARWQSFTPPLNLIAIGELAVTFVDGYEVGWLSLARQASATRWPPRACYSRRSVPTPGGRCRRVDWPSLGGSRSHRR